MSLFKFLPGLVILQVATAALLINADASAHGANWALIGAAGAIIALLVGLWFSSLADHLKKDALAQVREDFARERERFLVAAEADKRTIVEESHNRIVEETNRAHAKANFKLGAALVAMLGFAGVLLYIELVTLALVTITTAGGALAGYVVRARQDSLALKKKAAEAALAQPYTIEVIQGGKAADPPRPALTSDRKRA